MNSMKNIPFGRQNICRRDINAVMGALAADFITRGPLSGDFESALCAYTGARYAVAVSSGTAALHLACLAAGVSRGSGVLVPALSFVASSNCVLYCGGRPVFCDVLKEDGTIDPEDMRRKASAGRCSAVIPVNLAGIPCRMKEIRRIADKYGLSVIEDNAQGLGAEYGGSMTSSCRDSDMSILSFHPQKCITTGEGGAVLTNNRKLYKILAESRSHGIVRDGKRFKSSPAGPGHYEMQSLGYNYRITDFQCALGISQLGRIREFLRERRRQASLYAGILRDVEPLRLPPEAAGVHPAWTMFPVLVGGGKRKPVYSALRRHGVEAQVNFMPIYRHPYYRQQAEYRGVRCPRAETYYDEVIYLPVFPGLKKEQITFVCSILRQACGSK